MDVTQEVTQGAKAKRGAAEHRRSRITEQGGVGLVAFHLARRGHEFVVTYNFSPHGDIWVQIGDRKIGIEVKATLRGRCWHVPRKQTDSVDFYCLVHLSAGACFVLTSEEVKQLIAQTKDTYPGVAMLQADALPRDAINGWHRLDQAETDPRWRPLLGATLPVATADPAGGRRGRGVNKVSKRLADGTVKVYEYPRRTRPRMTLKTLLTSSQP